MIYKKILIMLLISSCESEVIIYKKSTRPCTPSNVQCLSENTYTFCVNKGKHSVLLHFVFNCPRRFLCNDNYKYPCVKDLNHDFSITGNSVRIDEFSKLASDSSESTTTPTNPWTSLTEMFRPGMTAATLSPTPALDLGITELPTAISQLIETELPTTIPVVTENPTIVSGPFTTIEDITPSFDTTMLKTYESVISLLSHPTFRPITTMLPTTTSITTEVETNTLKPVLPTIIFEPFTTSKTYEALTSAFPLFTFKPVTTMLSTSTSTTTEVPNITSKLILPTSIIDLRKSGLHTLDTSIKTMLPPVILKLTTTMPAATISQPSTISRSTVPPSVIESPIRTASTTFKPTRSTILGISEPKLTTTVLPTTRRRLTRSTFKSTTVPNPTDDNNIDLTTIESREAIDVPTRRTIIKIKFKLKRKTTIAKNKRRTTVPIRASTTPIGSITVARTTPTRISLRSTPTVTATRATTTRSSTRPTPTVTAARTTVTRSSTRPTPTVTATRTTVTRTSTRPTPTVTATRTTVTRRSTRPTPIVTATRTTVTRSSTRPTPTVTPTRTTVTRSSTRPTPTVTITRSTPTTTITRTTPTTTTTRSRTNTRRPTITVTRTTPTTTVTRTTTSIPTTTYVITTRRLIEPPICTEPGNHPATDCYEYYECVTVWWWYEYRLKTCPPGYSFSETVGDCVPSDRSECID